MKRILSFTILVLFLFSFVTCFADSRSYEIYKVDINAVIMDNGDLNVTEYLSYTFDGNFNDFRKELNINGADGCIVNSVSIIDKTGVETIAKESEIGEENTYEVSQEEYKTSVKLFSKSSNEDKIFKVNYTAKNVVKIYNSKAELYWSFYSVENIQSIKDMNIALSFNNQKLTDENSEYEIFGDGDKSNSYIDNGININCKRLSSIIGIDLVMPEEFLINSKNISNNSNYRKNDEKESRINLTSSNKESAFFILIIGGVIALIIILIVYENKKQIKAIEKYRSEYTFISSRKYKEPPSDISPVLVNLLLYNKNISREMISSTLFYLCNLGYYSMKEVKYTEKGVFSNKVKNDLIFKRDINRNSPSEPHLNFIIELFFSYEVNAEFSLMNIQKSLKKYSEVRYLLNKLNEWRIEVIQDSKEREFFIMFGNREVLTNEAYNEKMKWLSYKEFIENTVNNNNLLQLNSVDIMLVYAKALGVNNTAIENYTKTLVNESQVLKEQMIDSIGNINSVNYTNYYLLYMNNMESIYNTVTCDNPASFHEVGEEANGGDISNGRS